MYVIELTGPERDALLGFVEAAELAAKNTRMLDFGTDLAAARAFGRAVKKIERADHVGGKLYNLRGAALPRPSHPGHSVKV